MRAVFLSRALLIGVTVACGVRLAPAQEPGSSRTTDARRVRWDSLSENEKRVLRERFAQFRRLPFADQERFREDARRLDDLRARMEAVLPPDVVEQLRALEPHEKFQALRAALEGHLGERRDLLRRFLPPGAIEGLRGLPSRERAQEIRTLLREAHRAAGMNWLTEAAKRLPPAEVERLRALPEAERFREFTRLRKARSIADLEARPDFFDRMPRDLWERMKALPPGEFFPRLSLWRAGERARGLPLSGERGPALRFPRYLQPTPEEWEKINSLSVRERREELERLGREKARIHLRDVLRLSPQEVDRITSLPREEFFRALRDLEAPDRAKPPGSF